MTATDQPEPLVPAAAPDAAPAHAARDAAARPFTPGYFHGTKAALAPGEFVMPGYAPNFGPRAHAAGWVYCSATLDAAIWGAELARGDASERGGRVYVVEPTGAVEDDPDLTNARFPGNPSRSFRSQAPLRVVGEVTGWRGHPPAALEAMRAAVARHAPGAEGDHPTAARPAGPPAAAAPPPPRGRPVRYNVAASLDGYIADADGGYDWIPHDPAVDFAALFARVDTVLFGRTSYELTLREPAAAAAVPTGARVYVFSRTLRPEDHPSVTVVRDDAAGVVRALRAEPGDGEIWLYGGGTLFAGLLAAGQVDAVEVTVVPVLLGGGVPLLPARTAGTAGAARVGLTLTGTHVYPSGMAALRYAVPSATP